MAEDTKTAEPAETREDAVHAGYVKRRISHIIYPALLNAGSAVVILLLCYGLGTAVVTLARPTYGLSNDVVRVAIGWLSLLYVVMIISISLQGLWYLSKSEVAAVRSNAVADSQEPGERK